jgi:GT2 family glycosyltransferase
MKIEAVVVTYNRRQLLAECLRSLSAQTRRPDSVLVVDNASTDGTPEMVRELAARSEVPMRVLKLPENRGGAGGFAAGIDAGRDGECDWLWLMDDDVEPEPDALERLISSPPALDGGTACLAPKVVYANGGIDLNQRGRFRRRLIPLRPSEYRTGEYPSIGYMSFVGSLLRVDAARRIEPPRADFFVWGDDVEYSLRLRQVGEIRLVSESVIVHKRSAHAYSNRRSRLWNAISPMKLYPTPIERFWQNLAGLRNYVWMKRHYEQQSAVSAVGTTLQFVAKHLLIDDRPLLRIPWIVRYARAGRRGDFTNIDPEAWRAMVARTGGGRRGR